MGCLFTSSADLLLELFVNMTTYTLFLLVFSTVVPI